MFCHKLIFGFWSDQSETYMYVIYMGWSCAPLLGGGVTSSVFLREGSEHSPSQHFNDLSESFFLTWARLNKKSKSCQDHFKVTSRSCQGHVEVVTWNRQYYKILRWAIMQESSLITRKQLLIDVLSFLESLFVYF